MWLAFHHGQIDLFEGESIATVHGHLRHQGIIFLLRLPAQGQLVLVTTVQFQGSREALEIFLDRFHVYFGPRTPKSVEGTNLLGGQALEVRRFQVRALLNKTVAVENPGTLGRRWDFRGKEGKKNRKRQTTCWSD